MKVMLSSTSAAQRVSLPCQIFSSPWLSCLKRSRSSSGRWKPLHVQSAAPSPPPAQSRRSLLAKGRIRDAASLTTNTTRDVMRVSWIPVFAARRSLHGTVPSRFTACSNGGRLSGQDNVDLSDSDGEDLHADVEDERFWNEPTTSKAELKPGLYMVGTPIGNLEDITLRALRVLKSAACILAEDTRHSAKLLQHYNIRVPTMSYHKFNENARKVEIINRLQRGEILALISDAGMPGISDPGSELVKACIEANVRVFPVPGPSAALSALVVSGLPVEEFTFVGFLSAQSSARQRRLVTAARESATQIFYVPPHKLCRVLDDMIPAFGSSRRCAVAREMTKFHEEFWRGTLGKARTEFGVRRARGELTLVVQGLPEESIAHLTTEEELKSRLQVLLDAGSSLSEATKQVVEESSARRNTVYSLALRISKRPK